MTLDDIKNYLSSPGADAYIVTRSNMFIGQDILLEENKIQELTGFTGSAGNLIVFAKNKAVLLVDGRYDLQARYQVNQEQVEVVCTRDSLGSWIHHNLHEPQKFIYDAWCHSISEVDYWRRSLDWHEFIEDTKPLLGSRISDKKGEIFDLQEEFAGVTADEKISYLTKFMSENHLDGYLLCESDSVSWLLNLRSDLIPYSRIMRAYALVKASGEVSLFTSDFTKLEEEIADLSNKTIGANYGRTPKKIQFVFKKAKVNLRNINNPIIDWKAIKNPVEISGFKNCHLRDGVAVCRFLSWLEDNCDETDELSCVSKLHEYRVAQKNYCTDSFATIAGFASNGAIIHYQPNEDSNKKLQNGSLLLLDSGAHYLDGTTDITRTIAIGTPTIEMIADYTQVLKAHIALSSQIFPVDTSGAQLDAITRAVLWNTNKDYAHGTGHGVGYCLNVHEGPQSISLKNAVGLKSGMICSIEPGYYYPDHYGIRIENLSFVSEDKEGWLKFTPLTVAPYDRKLIDKKLLTSSEIAWINNYHQMVLSELEPLLDDKTLAWLKIQTAAL